VRSSGGWVDEVATLVRIRELRNLIGCEYASEKLAEPIYTAVLAVAPELLAVVPKVHAYAEDLIKTYPVSSEEPPQS